MFYITFMIATFIERDSKSGYFLQVAAIADSTKRIVNNTSIKTLATTNDTLDDKNTFKASKDVKVDTLCGECRITSESLENLLRQPRQMNAYGQLEERIDLDKIKKAVCKDIVNDTEREKCRNFFYTQSSVIEKWKLTRGKTTFFDFVCIKELKVCCPRNSYGTTCKKCNKCGINEQCYGEGTRSGNGECICNQGHTGLNCSKCMPRYYSDIVEETPNSTRVVCKPCHKSCLYCRREGPLGCEVCQSGYTWVPTYGCSDIDECIRSGNKICGDNTFCVNTEGSYFCYECDRACNGCHGDGPDMCLKCAKGYNLDRGNCVALKKTILPPEANYYRYAIYTGLCVCTCIIFHNNVYFASLVGISVAMYIGVSEYVMSTHLKELNEQGVSMRPTITTGQFSDL